MIRPATGTARKTRRSIGPDREEPSFRELLTDSALHRVQSRVRLTAGIKELLKDYEKNLLDGYDSGDVKVVGMLEAGFGLISDEKEPMEVFFALSRIEAELRKVAEKKEIANDFEWPNVPESLGHNEVTIQLLLQFRKIAVELGLVVVDATGYPLGYNAREISNYLNANVKEVETILDLMEADNQVRVIIVEGERYCRIRNE
ncbi:hypothetical protein HY570_04080 [Candidatus Micrarchaeota archaeon]|nr:hypothetical protein [Candidatus Micrarchaeota archaeon]